MKGREGGREGTYRGRRELDGRVPANAVVDGEEEVVFFGLVEGHGMPGQKLGATDVLVQLRGREGGREGGRGG